jgi:signal transduction histidine kinase
LHDAIGHHLAALNLQLDLALRQVGSHANESVQTARALAQCLLAEVRIVVGSERAQQDFNLRQALETLCAGIPAPRIALSCDDRLELHSPTLAHTLFCAMQEAISNTVRHAGAKVMHIVLSNGNEGLTISISDDGKGLPTMAALHAGNGLRGMRERIEAHGGTLEAANRPEGGFGMQIRLPRSGDAQ